MPSAAGEMRDADTGRPHPGLRPWLEAELGEPVSSLRPLSWGEQNLVVQAVTSTGRRLVARVSHRDVVSRRAQVFRHCFDRGLPIPPVVASGDWDEAGALVVEHVAGVPLDRLAGPGSDLMVEVGRILARLHSIPTTGAGPMHAPGHGSAASWADVVLAVSERPMQPPSANAGSVIEGAFVALQRLRDIDIAPCFLHGDWAPRHVIVDGGGTPWVIDVDDAVVGDPAWDFACWEHQSGSMDAVADLMAGYRDLRDPGPHLALRMRLHRLALHASVLADAWERGAAASTWEPLLTRMVQDTRAVNGTGR